MRRQGLERDTAAVSIKTRPLTALVHQPSAAPRPSNNPKTPPSIIERAFSLLQSRTLRCGSSGTRPPSGTASTVWPPAGRMSAHPSVTHTTSQSGAFRAAATRVPRSLSATAHATFQVPMRTVGRSLSSVVGMIAAPSAPQTTHTDRCGKLRDRRVWAGAVHRRRAPGRACTPAGAHAGAPDRTVWRPLAWTLAGRDPVRGYGNRQLGLGRSRGSLASAPRRSIQSPSPHQWRCDAWRHPLPAGLRHSRKR